jgi:hypothetical protein
LPGSVVEFANAFARPGVPCKGRVVRRHLPARRLCQGVFPLVVDARGRLTMILPKRYWPGEFVGWRKQT